LSEGPPRRRGKKAGQRKKAQEIRKKKGGGGSKGPGGQTTKKIGKGDTGPEVTRKGNSLKTFVTYLFRWKFRYQSKRVGKRSVGISPRTP